MRLNQKGPAKHRHVKGQMNGTEREFYHAFLQPLELAGLVLKCEFEKHTLTLARRCTYLPDFVLTMADGSKKIIEVKGGIVYDGAREKFLWAAEKYGGEYEFEAWQKKRGQWKRIWI
jgi:hypothetical protein